MGTRTLAGLAAVVVAAGFAGAQEPRPDADRDADGGLLARFTRLAPAGCADDLNLDEAQRQRLRQLEQECQQKTRAALTQTAFKVYGVIKSMERHDETAEPAPGLAIAHEIVGGILEARRARVRAERQLLTALNPDQKEQFVALKDERPRDRRVRDDGDGVALTSRLAQRRLKLDDEQVRKIEAIHAEADAKVREVLTEEQLKRYEQMTGRRGERKSLKPKDRD
jgi:Spy/CpxP family protein refolding chaperone